MERRYRKPNGTHTINFDEYVKSWTALIEPICVLTGYRLTGFDPHFQLCNDDWQTTTLSVDFVQKLNAALKGAG